jgi:hypothetical protein
MKRYAAIVGATPPESTVAPEKVLESVSEEDLGWKIQTHATKSAPQLPNCFRGNLTHF